MCELTGDKMAEATRDELRRVDVMAKTLNGIDAFFAPHLARAEAQSRKIAEAARLAREAEDGHEGRGERMAEEAERRARAESESAP